MPCIQGRPRYSAWLVFIAAMAIPRVVPAQESSQTEVVSSDGGFPVSATLSLAGTTGAARVLSLDLGELPAGEEGVLTLSIVNPFDEPIPLANVQASPRSRPQRVPNVIPARGEATFEILLRVPSSGKSAEVEGVTTIYVDREKCKIPALRLIPVKFRFSIAGMLSFMDRSLLLKVGPGESREISIPFIHTLRSPVEDLRLEATGFARGVPGKLVPGEPMNHVRLTVSAEDARQTGEHGSIILSARDSEAECKIDLILFLESSMQISPHTLTFLATEDGLEANAIVHFSGIEGETDSTGEPNEQAGDGQGPGSVYCEAFVHGKKLAVKQQRMGDFAYRVQLHFQGDAKELAALGKDAGGEPVIVWNIVADREKRAVKSPFRLPSR